MGFVLYYITWAGLRFYPSLHDRSGVKLFAVRHLSRQEKVYPETDRKQRGTIDFLAQPQLQNALRKPVNIDHQQIVR